MKTDNFVDLMKDFQNNYNKNMDTTVFLDNASVHHSKKFKEFTRDIKIHVYIMFLIILIKILLNMYFLY